MDQAGVKRAMRALAGLAAATVAVTVLTGCSGKQYLAVNDSGDHTALPAGGASASLPPPMQPAARPTPASDQCGAAPLQYLVGKMKDEIPVALVPSRRRVVCTTCPATMDMRPDRQTIRYDEATKKVVSVTCG